MERFHLRKGRMHYLRFEQTEILLSQINKFITPKFEIIRNNIKNTIGANHYPSYAKTRYYPELRFDPSRTVNQAIIQQYYCRHSLYDWNSAGKNT